MGKTVQPLSKRLAAHVSCRRGTHRSNWIQSLKRCGLKPSISLVQTVDVAHWRAAEIYWISYFRWLGCPLTNLAAGGVGTDGFRHTEEAKRRIGAASVGRTRKGYRHTEDAKRRIGAASRGNKYRLGTVTSEETIARLRASSTGRRHSPATVALLRAHRHTEAAKQKIKQARLGTKRSADTRAKLSRALTGNTNASGKRSDEARERMSLAALRRHRNARAALEG